ncbi:MAG: hypothetical protein WAM91_11835 [Candidatus Acidiferrales bacterium]
MRRQAQLVSIVALALTLASIPAIAGPSSSLGVVTGADKANVARVAAVDGTSVYDGDIISTQPTGAIRLRMGQSQLVLAGNSTVMLHKTDTGVYATLLRGMVRFSSVPGSPLEVRALDSLVIHAKGDKQVVGQLTLVGPTLFEVGSSKGDLTVSIDGADHVVAESTAYRVSMDDANGGSNNSPGRRGAFWIWFPIALVTLAVVIPLVLVFESPSTPGN